jgi:hypothetical protein
MVFKLKNTHSNNILTIKSVFEIKIKIKNISFKKKKKKMNKNFYLVTIFLLNVCLTQFLSCWGWNG